MRRASIKETGEEISAAEWARFDAAVASAKAERRDGETSQTELALNEARDGASSHAAVHRDGDRRR